jgi:ABC-type Fe3+-hydroxamate transport system substrate-binding protein
VLLSLERVAGRLGELLTAGPGSFYDELLARLGVENVLADAASPFPRIGVETILARRPEVIVEIQAEAPSAEGRKALLADWKAFPDLPAVQAGRVEVVGGSFTLVPGPRLPLLYRGLARAILGGRVAAADGR